MNSTDFLLSEKHGIIFVRFRALQLPMFTQDKNRLRLYACLLAGFAIFPCSEKETRAMPLASHGMSRTI